MPRIGTPEQFRTARNFLRTRYNEPFVCAALGIASMNEFGTREAGRPVRDLLVRVLFAGAAVPAGQFHSAVPGDVLDALLALGLIEQSTGAVACPVMIVPSDDLFLVTDRFTQPDGTAFEADRDFVYFPLTDNTRNYIASLPDRPCESFLDVGAGCGAAALVQARYARTSVASDISPRSTLFARFNALLNDLENVETVQGSLYEPVASRTFDRIGCHPPYDLSSAAPWSFADGGDDGEFVIRGVVEGLPDHLAPGGEFIGLFRASDRDGAPLEQRIRTWLGERHTEFDVAIVVRDTTSPRDYALASVLSTSGELSQARDMIKRLDEMEIQQLPYVHSIIRRRTGRSEPVTLRRDLGARCTALELEWLLEWESLAPSMDLSDAVLKVSAASHLLVRHEIRGGAMRPVDYSLVSKVPFATEMQCPEWIAVLLSHCDGNRTTNDVYGIMKETAPIQPEQFCAAVKRLVSGGVLQLAPPVR